MAEVEEVADLTNKPFKLDAVAWNPDGTITMCGWIGIMPQKLTLDKDSWKRITEAVEWKARQT